MPSAKYTIVLKTLMDNPESKALLDKALSTYPLHTPKNPNNHSIIPTRDEINKKLLNHYKYREIGFETFGRFLDELEISMNEIMPYYNQLFNSEDIINGLEDIFGNLDVKEEFSEDRTSSSNSSGESSDTTTSEGSDTTTTHNNMNDSSKHVKTDTPQNALDIVGKEINQVPYASEINWNESSSESDGSSTGETSSTATRESNVSSNEETTGTTTHTLTRKGNQGVNTYAHDMLEFRNLFMNIVQQIIEDKRIQELFMQVY